MRWIGLGLESETGWGCVKSREKKGKEGKGIITHGPSPSSSRLVPSSRHISLLCLHHFASSQGPKQPVQSLTNVPLPQRIDLLPQEP